MNILTLMEALLTEQLCPFKHNAHFLAGLGGQQVLEHRGESGVFRVKHTSKPSQCLLQSHRIAHAHLMGLPTVGEHPKALGYLPALGPGGKCWWL